jgi:hypothetical protein
MTLLAVLAAITADVVSNEMCSDVRTYGAVAECPTEVRYFDIKPGMLYDSLRTYSEIVAGSTKWETFYIADSSIDFPSPGIEGYFTITDALTTLLSFSKLDWQLVGRTTIAIREREQRLLYREGYAWSCVPIRYAIGMLVQSPYTQLWDVSVGMGMIPDEQQYCVVDHKLPNDDDAPVDAEVTVMSQGKPRPYFSRVLRLIRAKFTGRKSP